MDPRTRLLLEAPIARTLLKLGAPNVLVMFSQAAVGLIETYFVGKLGTDALAGGLRDDANALVQHAVVIALGFGFVFTIAMLSGGRWIYSLMGGQGDALEAALVYSNGVFAGAALIWFFNALSALIRGTGNMMMQAVVMVGGAVLLVPLVFGLGAPLVAMVGTCIGAG